MTSDDRYFASVAETYDRLQPIVAGPSYRAGLDFVLDLVPHEDDDKFVCVELGCGTGVLTKMLLDRFPSARFHAVDGEPAMLAIARQKLAPYGNRATVAEVDILPYRPPECDVVVSSFVFHHIPPEKLPDTFRRIFGALRPGGCFILLDQMTVGPAWGKRVGQQGRRLLSQHVAEAVSAGLATQDEVDARLAFKRKMKEDGNDVEYRHRAEDILAAMAESGFREAGVVWRHFASTILFAFVG